MNITLVAGARPNFIKIKPLIRAIEDFQKQGNPLDYRLIHTGQHSDKAMSSDFFTQLNIPSPHLQLSLNFTTTIEQITQIMLGLEREFVNYPPDLLIVVGDVNSTMAGAIVAKKLNIPLAHVEAGIRSFDNSMPEEINRKLTDSITDLFFTTTEFASQQLIKEGIDKNKIYFVGNVMIDTLVSQLEHLKKPLFFDGYNIVENNYFVLTLHRPNNVDEQDLLLKTLQIIDENSNGLPILFPIHPRTQKVLSSLNEYKNIIFLPPLNYLEFIYTIKNAKGVITDSGGITEETTYLNVPCITLRDSTERPETCEIGTNLLVGVNPEAIIEPMKSIISDNWKKGSIPEKWDGKSAARIIEIIVKEFAL
jgi:UDP-N-acetylglucosamine 2-epimerase (non-hydrolysing)